MKPILEIADGLMASVATTEKFLEFLRMASVPSFRRKIHKTDAELEELVNQNIEAQLTASRDYYLLFEFVERNGLQKEFHDFHSMVMADVLKTIEGRKDDNTRNPNEA